jgi:uncharacterized protein
MTDAGLFSAPKPVIGMLHLPPLPGTPSYSGELEAVRSFVLRDAEALAEGGVDGLLLENFGDAPFFPERVPVYVVAHMTALAVEIRRRFDLPLGINVLRNDGRSALAIAHAARAQFVRVNVLCGARVTDQGLIQAIAHDLLRDRALLGATSVKIFADINVKHSAPLAARPIDEEVEELLNRGGADTLIVTGTTTGRPVELDELLRVRAAAKKGLIFGGSGVTPESLPSYLPFLDGFIVGTSLKRDGLTSNPVDLDRVKRLVQQLTSLSR